MTLPLRFLAGVSSPLVAAAEPPSLDNVESDYVVIMAALLCALICAVGLVVVARCTWLRRRLHGGPVLSSFAHNPAPPPAIKGLKKKILRSLPTHTFNAAVNGKLADCAICLTELVDGDEIRVLPECRHVFHVNCIDAWLGCNSSCPSCRQILVVARCQKCGGGFPAAIRASGAEAETDLDLEK